MSLELAQAFVLGALSSVAASFILIYLLRIVLSPQILIEEYIIFGHNRNNNPVIKFKIINMKGRQAINVNVTAHRVIRGDNIETPYSYTKIIPLVTENIMVMEAHDPQQERTDYYNVINTRAKGGYEGVHDIFEENQGVEIRLRVAATDPISQIRVVKTKYFSRHCVRYGNFIHPRETPEFRIEEREKREEQ